jgi:hypothetical protein
MHKGGFGCPSVAPVRILWRRSGQQVQQDAITGDRNGRDPEARVVNPVEVHSASLANEWLTEP